MIVYWLGNFQPTAQAFFTWIMWLFLDLIAAESLVVLVSSIFPNFVISLALTAFANGLWMSVNGFMVSPKLLNVFWRYVFHYIDYQAYGKPYFHVNLSIIRFIRRVINNSIQNCKSFNADSTIVFQGMMVNEFADRVYSCGSGCQCMFQTHMVDQCSFSGLAVLDQYGFRIGRTGEWVGILLAIVLVLRLLGWAALWVRK